MLLTVRFLTGGPAAFGMDAAAGEEEFWFGRGLGWTSVGAGIPALHFSLLVDTPKIVARTKRRDREIRFGVGFCDPYTYSAWGLMSVFLSRFASTFKCPERRSLELEFVAYPERPYSAEMACRLFRPVGYEVEVGAGRLALRGVRGVGEALSELPALLLALDRRTRLFLTKEELSDIATSAGGGLRLHPARKAIEPALAGEATPLRLLLPLDVIVPRERKASEPVLEQFEEIRQLSSSLVPKISIATSQRDFALGVLNRVNVDFKWLIYLPSAIASVQSIETGDELERPESALCYFRDERIESAVVEEKHMGSRGIVVLCRSLKAARDRFGVDAEVPGCAYTRNGRRFFQDEDTESVFLERLGKVLEHSNFWNRFSTNWACFDGEIMPWAMKASDSEESDLVSAGMKALGDTQSALEVDSENASLAYWRELIEAERTALSKYDAMFQRYRAEAVNLSALKFAPFHLLAVEGRTFFGHTHLWHMQVLNRLSRSGEGFVIPTRYEVTETANKAAWHTVLDWWEEISAEGAEGLVIKPLPFVAKGRRGRAQPALKVRSWEHLRLVYGPKYDSQEVRESLKARAALQNRRNKHRRILRQFALSMEAVTRFVQRSSLDAVHECILGVLAQEVAPTMSS